MLGSRYRDRSVGSTKFAHKGKFKKVYSPLSAAVGNFAPQKYVWQLCVCLHAAPRLLICQLHLAHMDRVLSRCGLTRQLTLLCCSCNIAEIFSLLLLSVVPSAEDFFLHKLSFTLFLLFSVLFMGTSYYLFRLVTYIRITHVTTVNFTSLVNEKV